MCMGFLILCSAANELKFANICTVFTYLRDSDMRPVNNSMRGGTTHQPKSTTATPRPLPIALGVRLFSHDQSVAISFFSIRYDIDTI